MRRILGLPLGFVVAACSEKQGACGAGFERWPDGNCYPAGLQGTGDAPVLPDDVDTKVTTGTTVTTEDELYDGPVYVEFGTSRCTADDVSLFFTIRTRGWAFRGAIAAFGTGLPVVAGEEHSLLSKEWDPAGWWDLLEVGPLVGSVASQFTCEDEDLALLSFAGRVWDLDGNLQDCAVWGHDTGRMIANGVPMDAIEEPKDLSACFAL